MRRLFLYCVLMSLCFSCAREQISGLQDDDMVRVEILAPEVYGFAPQLPDTKAVGDHNDVLPDHTRLRLEEGATLWLTYELRKTAEGVTPAEYEDPVLKAYVVRNSGGGYKALYACAHSEVDGKLVVNADDASTTAVPLYLKSNETYRFRMISPALPIYASNLSMKVDNGDSFCASDERYEQTRSSDTKISADVSGVNYIRLNPMIQQTARLKFVFTKGDNVSSIKMMSDGVEISGIQDPYYADAGTLYNWSSMNAADTLVMRKGDKRAWISLPGDEFETESDGSLSGSVCILPTDARSNSVTILMNMSVNGVPTQYLTVLNGMVFEHGKSYNMTFEVGLKNNVVVVNWQNVSWTENI